MVSLHQYIELIRASRAVYKGRGEALAVHRLCKSNLNGLQNCLRRLEERSWTDQVSKLKIRGL